MRVRSRTSLLFVSFLIVAGGSVAAEDVPAPKLLGSIERGALSEAPFSEWFETGFAEYEPDPTVLERLRGILPEDLRVDVFFGTWCGDSRREVPRMARLLEAAGLDGDRVRWIAVDNAEGSLKRSPGGEDAGLEIWRVPTVVLSRGETEIGRIVENPVLSLERDLVTVLAGGEYAGAYPAYPIVRSWLAGGLLDDPNVSPWGLATLVRPVVRSEHDLAAVGRVMQDRGDVARAVRVYEVNRGLFPDSAAAAARLADALLRTGDVERARAMAERAVRLNDDPDLVETLVEILERAAASSAGAVTP